MSASNQVKAYDFCFVAGQAAIDRMASGLMFTDATTWCRAIGRPQLDVHPVVTTGSGDLQRPTLLYAPTWEGAQPSLAYGSVGTLGLPMIKALLDSGQVVVRYRPHPLAGVTDGAYGAADAAIRRLIEESAAAESGVGHRVEVAGTLEQAFAGADVLVCDVSAVAMDWLPSGKPFLVTEPSAPEVVTARTRMLDVVPRLTGAGVPELPDLVRRLVTDDPGRQDRLDLIEYYLGDVTPGVATRRFLDACTEVIEERDRQWAVIESRGVAGR